MGHVTIPRRFCKTESEIPYLYVDKYWDISDTGTVGAIADITKTNTLYIFGEGKAIDSCKNKWGDTLRHGETSYTTSLPTNKIMISKNISVSSMSWWFGNMKVTSLNLIPDGVTDISYLLAASEYAGDITKLKIPDSVTNMTGMFWYGHTNFNLDGFVIPENVNNIKNLFYCVRGATGTITIMGNPTTYDCCFAGTAINSGKQIIVNYTSKCTNINNIIAANHDAGVIKGNVIKGVCIDA